MLKKMRSLSLISLVLAFTLILGTLPVNAWSWSRSRTVEVDAHMDVIDVTQKYKGTTINGYLIDPADVKTFKLKIVYKRIVNGKTRVDINKEIPGAIVVKTENTGKLLRAASSSTVKALITTFYWAADLPVKIFKVLCELMPEIERVPTNP